MKRRTASPSLLASSTWRRNTSRLSAPCESRLTGRLALVARLLARDPAVRALEIEGRDPASAAADQAKLTSGS
ncbi:MAG TPA: hypothetical protein VFO01_07700 [Trebonia sp.]|nr:hypothetical protein [Trebonia sp.]